MRIPLLTLLCCFMLSGTLQGQSTRLDRSGHAHQLSERYEIRTGYLRNNVYTDLGPISRKDAAGMLTAIDTFDISLSESDRFNIAYLKADLLPYTADDDDDWLDNDDPVLRYFYRSQANLFHVNTERFKLFVNPGLNLQAGYSDNDDGTLYMNTRSAEVRGSIDEKVGFYSYISENQILPAEHEINLHDSIRSYPGAHFTKRYDQGGADFLKARGYITFSPVESIGIQFGQDRNFIGNGYRSLLLSDVAPSYPFLKINTNVWRFNYQNLFARMTDRAYALDGGGLIRPNPNKYIAAHYLSFDILDNLNIGLFESVTFYDIQGNGRGFDVAYLNPVIFYRAVEHQLGDPDKVLVGLNLRYLPFKDVQLYGQLMLNEFRWDDLTAREGHNANKYGFQAGVDYIDAFTVSNLDVGLEWNYVRPYSYTHYTVSGDYPVNSYTHYNQALAHPLGANFQEWIATIEVQPLPRLHIGGRYIHANYGADSHGSNWGQNIFLDYRTNERELGNYTGQGVSTNLDLFNGWISYHFWHNIFVELDIRYRSLSSEIEERNANDLYVGATIRLNEARKGWWF